MYGIELGLGQKQNANRGARAEKAPLKVEKVNEIKHVNEELLELLLCTEAVWKVQSWCWTSSMPRWLSREVPGVSMYLTYG